MARQSKTDHVRKICNCAKWKDCAHPWYIRYAEGSGEKRRGLEKRLGPLVGREPVSFADAKAEAKRAILAWQEGRDATTLLPGDAPTLTAVLDAYGQRPNGAPLDRYQRAQVIKVVVNGRAFGEWRAAEITRDMVEAFRRQRPRVAGNRDLALLRALFNWAVLNELVSTTPFKVGTVTAIKLNKEESRTRRLHPGEHERLLGAATGHLRDLIVAALETGCRKGELLSLQWHQVRGELFLPGGKTKSKKPRRVPVSTVLRSVLERRRLDPAGEPLPPDAFVFGDEVGRRRRALTRAWTSAVLRAHGHTPQYVGRPKGEKAPGKRPRRTTAKLTPESRELLRAIDLHFHDLRREAGSRWMDANVPLATIQRWLGHHNISQTSTYLAASGGGDADAMRAFEAATGRYPQIPPFAGPDGRNQAPSEPVMLENTEENRTIH